MMVNIADALIHQRALIEAQKLGGTMPAQGVLQTAHGAQVFPPNTISSKFTDGNMYTMLAARMGWNVSSPACPFAKTVVHKLNADQAVVYIAHDGKAITIHDDLNLFPSDALVTQLRLLVN